MRSHLETRLLGRTNLPVTVLGLGAAYLGLSPDDGCRAQARPGLGPILPLPAGDEVAQLRDAKDTIRVVLERGCTLIDTAAGYQCGGSESLIREAFQEWPDLAANVLVTTKVGHLPAGYDGTYDMAMRCIEGSMQRLGVERFPLLYIHDPMGFPTELIMSDRGVLGALRTLQKRGLLDHVGVAANDPEVNAAYLETGEFDAAVVPEAWSLINRLAEERIFPAAERHGTGLVIATPLEIGLLAFGARGSRTFPRRRFSEEVLTHVCQLEDICDQYGVSLTAAALQYAIQPSVVAAVIPGARNPQEARANIAAMEERIPVAFWEQIRPLLRHWDADVHRLAPTR